MSGRYLSKALGATLIAVFVLALAAPAADAQVPYVRGYYDDSQGSYVQGCTRDAVATVYFTAHNFNAWIRAVEFSVHYPSIVEWIGDTVTTPLVLGNTPNGIAIVWQVPLNGYEPVVLVESQFIYHCDDCVIPPGDSWFTVEPAPWSGLRRAVAVNIERYQENISFEFDAAPTIIGCELTPVQDKTWGAIKALYKD